jgi:hypothetical protein
VRQSTESIAERVLGQESDPWRPKDQGFYIKTWGHEIRHGYGIGPGWDQAREIFILMHEVLKSNL